MAQNLAKRFEPYNKAPKGPCCGWGFTDFKHLDFSGLVSLLGSSRIAYLTAGLETCPSTQRKHSQGFVWFRLPQHFETVRRLLPGAHLWKVCLIEHSVRYAQKAGAWQSFGEMPTTKANQKVIEAVAEKRDKELDGKEPVLGTDIKYGPIKGAAPVQSGPQMSDLDWELYKETCRKGLNRLHHERADKIIKKFEQAENLGIPYDEFFDPVDGEVYRTP